MSVKRRFPTWKVSVLVLPPFSPPLSFENKIDYVVTYWGRITEKITTFLIALDIIRIIANFSSNVIIFDDNGPRSPIKIKTTTSGTTVSKSRGNTYDTRFYSDYLLSSNKNNLLDNKIKISINFSSIPKVIQFGFIQGSIICEKSSKKVLNLKFTELIFFTIPPSDNFPNIFG